MIFTKFFCWFSTSMHNTQKQRINKFMQFELQSEIKNKPVVVEAAYETTFEGYGSATRHPCSTMRLHVLPTFCPLA